METKQCIGSHCKAAGEGTSRVVFATTGVIDKDGDWTAAGAFGRQEARIQPAHDRSAPSLGKASVFEKGDEAQADLLWNLAMPLASDWHSSIKFSFERGLGQDYSYAYDVIEQDASLARKVGARRALLKVRVIEVSPVLVGAGVGTRTLEIKHCHNCGNVIEPPKAHACSCGAKATGAGDLAAVVMADLLAEVKALRSEVAALKAPRVRLLNPARDFGPEFVARCMARVAASEARGNKRYQNDGY